MGISGKIVTDIEYASDCVLFNVKHKRFKKADFVQYNDIARYLMDDEEE